MNRRSAVTSMSLAAGYLGAATAKTVAAKATKSAPLKIGVIGLGGRGFSQLKTLLRFPEVQITAICDLNERGQLDRSEKYIHAKGGSTPAKYGNGPFDYRNLLDRDDVDAVMIATPAQLHAVMAIDAMNAGKDVGVEVPAAFEMDELWKLVDTKEKTGRHYMLLENYSYFSGNMMLNNMIDQGLFGDVYYAECAYLHDVRHLMFDSKGELTWRGEMMRDSLGSWYPTHSMGPVSKMLGINDGDVLEKCSCFVTAPRMVKDYAKKRFGADSPQAEIDFRNGDVAVTLLRTKNGKVITHNHDISSPRPSKTYYQIQGEKGVYNSRYNAIHLDPETNDGSCNSKHAKWDNIRPYAEKYKHPYWKNHGEDARATGHGGGDYFVIMDFLQMVRHQKEPWIDVYDAATWSAIYPCSQQSAMKEGAAVDMPDFTRGKWKDPTWRSNNLNPLKPIV